MINWLVEKLDKISTFNNYKKPIRNRGFVNLDANENYALKKRFISETMPITSLRVGKSRGL